MANALTFKRLLTAFLVVLLAVCTLILFKGYLDGHFQSIESLQAYVDSFGLLAPVALMVIQALQVVLPVLPGFLGCIVGAGMFGAMGGF